MSALETEVQAIHEEVRQILAQEQDADVLAKVGALQTTVEKLSQAVEQQSERKVADWVYPAAVVFLGVTMVAVVIGEFLLQGVWGGETKAPEALIAIGTAAVAALAGLVTFPTRK